MVSIGLAVFVLCAVFLIVEPVIEKNTGINLLKTPAQKVGVAIIGLFFMFLAFNPFSINDAGNRQVVQTLGGDLKVRFQPGLYNSGVWSKVTTYPNNVTIQVGPKSQRSPEADYWSSENVGTFAEGDQAWMGHTVKWDLPPQTEEMIALHVDYGSIDNLATTTLMQYQRETASYSCQRLNSEAHYSGGQSQLKDFFQDQLRNGQVLLNTETKVETQTDGSSRTYIHVSEQVDTVTGMWKRSPNKDIQQYGLTASFTSIDYIKYDSLIYVKLQTKIQFAADEANSKQELVAAQQKEQTAIVLGREQIATVRAEEEADEQRQVIRARKAKLVAREQAEKAAYVADKIEQEGRAQGIANRELVNAGLTPVQQMERDIKIADVVSKNVANAPTPQIVMLGGNNGGSADEALKVFGAERALELIKKMKN